MTNTADKRSAALQVGRPWRLTLPFPDGSISAFNRSHLAFSYYTSIGMPKCGWSVPAADRVFLVPPNAALFQIGPADRIFFVPPNAAVFQIGPADRLFEFPRCP